MYFVMGDDLIEFKKVTKSFGKMGFLMVLVYSFVTLEIKSLP